eukprot:gene3787-13855_t
MPDTDKEVIDDQNCLRRYASLIDAYCSRRTQHVLHATQAVLPGRTYFAHASRESVLPGRTYFAQARRESYCMAGRTLHKPAESLYYLAGSTLHKPADSLLFPRFCTVPKPAGSLYCLTDSTLPKPAEPSLLSIMLKAKSAELSQSQVSRAKSAELSQSQVSRAKSEELSQSQDEEGARLLPIDIRTQPHTRLVGYPGLVLNAIEDGHCFPSQRPMLGVPGREVVASD